MEQQEVLTVHAFSVLSCVMGFEVELFFPASFFVRSYKSFILCCFAAVSASFAKSLINFLLYHMLSFRTCCLASFHWLCASLPAALVLLLLILSFSFLLVSILLRVSAVIHSLCWVCWGPRVALHVSNHTWDIWMLCRVALWTQMAEQ